MITFLTHFDGATYQKYIFLSRMWCSTCQWSAPHVMEGHFEEQSI